MLGIYALVFMIALPTIVGIWWYRSVKYGGDQVLLDTTQLYYCFIHKTPHMMLKRVIMIVAASLEFERNHNSEVVERPTDNIEVPALIKEMPNLGEKNKERPLCFSYSIKARALLHAHLSRMKLPPNSLEIDKNYIVKKCPNLIQEFVQCVAQLTMLALAGRIPRIPSLDTLEYAMKLSPLIVQALWDSKSPLMQLPHISEETLRHFSSKRRNIRSLVQLAEMKNEERREMLRHLSDDQYEDIVNVLGNMPLIELDVGSEVLDDEESSNITAGAIVTVTVSLTRKSLSTLFDNASGETKITNGTVDGALDDAGDASETAELLPNGDATDVKKPKVWEKPNKGKKGKAKGGKNKKKQQQSHQQRKPQQQQPQPAAAAVPTETKVETESEHSDVSDIDQSDNEGDRGRDSDSEERKADASPVEEDEEDWDKFQQKMSKKDKKALETKSKVSHTVHCPYFADDKQEYWWIYLADKKKHALASIPVLMTNLTNKEEIELKFTAPPKPGVYQYSVIVRSDSYVDFDVSKPLKVSINCDYALMRLTHFTTTSIHFDQQVDVKEAKEIVSHPQWDISEEEDEADKGDEDSAVEDSDLIDDDDESGEEESDASENED